MNELKQTKSSSPLSLQLCSLCCATSSHLHVWGLKWVYGGGLHGLVNEEEESGHDGQQEELYPQRHVALCCLGLPCRREAGGGGFGWQAGYSVYWVALSVGGDAGLGGFWREQAVITPQVTGCHRAPCCSSDGPATGGTTRETFKI